MANQLTRLTFVVVALVVLAGFLFAWWQSRELPTPTEAVEDVVIQEAPSPVEDVMIEEQSGTANSEQQTTSADVMERPTEAVTWTKIPPARVTRGGGVRFIAEDHAAWIIIPDGRLKRSSGGKDWAKGKSFVAFKVETGDAVVMVPKDYPRSTTDVEIHYSVLARHAGGDWEYVHGENPPPRIIIR